MFEVSRVSDFEGNQIGIDFKEITVDEKVNDFGLIYKANLNVNNSVDDNYIEILEAKVLNQSDKIKALENELISVKMDNQRLENELTELMSVPEVDRPATLLRIEKLKTIRLEKDKKSLQYALNAMYEKLIKFEGK